MTMPDERTRAIRWGGELLELEQIASDIALLDTMISAAHRVALRYPTPEALEERLRSGAPGLPLEWTTALFEALDLFDAMRASALGSASTRSHLMYTLRHFPDQMTIRAMSRSSSMQEWLHLPMDW